MTLRPPRDDEFDAMLELMNAHQLAAFGEADATADDLRNWLTSGDAAIFTRQTRSIPSSNRFGSGDLV